MNDFPILRSKSISKNFIRYVDCSPDLIKKNRAEAETFKVLLNHRHSWLLFIELYKQKKRLYRRFSCTFPAPNCVDLQPQMNQWLLRNSARSKPFQKVWNFTRNKHINLYLYTRAIKRLNLWHHFLPKAQNSNSSWQTERNSFMKAPQMETKFAYKRCNKIKKS